VIPSESARAMLKNLLITLRKHSGKQVVVIIDEYDAPIHRLMFEDSKIQFEMAERLDDFHGVLKLLEQELRLVYITGILRLFQMLPFSKLNNLQDHTFSLGSNSICGYTREEIVQNFEPYLDKLRLKLNVFPL
jgi:hypothetical protein